MTDQDQPSPSPTLSHQAAAALIASWFQEDGCDAELCAECAEEAIRELRESPGHVFFYMPEGYRIGFDADLDSLYLEPAETPQELFPNPAARDE